MAIRLGELGLGMDVDGTLSLLAVGYNYLTPGAPPVVSLHALEQVGPNDGWSDWITFPSSPASAPSFSALSLVVQNFVDQQALTAFFPNLQSYVGIQSRPWRDSWSVWPGPPPTPDQVGPMTAVGITAERPTATLFTVASGWQVWVTVSADGWTNLSALPGGAVVFDNSPASSPGVAASKDGRLELFAVGALDGQLYHLWETAVGGTWSGAWSNWFSHGSPDGHFLWQTSPVLGTNLDGRLELFIVGTADPRQGYAGPLFHIWQTAPNNGWSGWFSHGRPSNVNLFPRPTIARGPDGRLELFVIGVDFNLYQIRQVAPNDGWSDWLMVPSPAGVTLTAGNVGNPVMAPSQDGRLELFVLGADGNLYHRWQTDYVGNWSGWTSHGKPT